MLKITRLAGMLVLVLSIAACSTPTTITITPSTPTTTTTSATPTTGAAADIQTLVGGLQQVEQNLPQDLAGVQTLTAAIDDIKAQASQPVSLATAQAIAGDVALLAPAANLIPPPYGQMVAAAATLAPVIVQEAGAAVGVISALAPAPGAMTADQARAILRGTK